MIENIRKEQNKKLHWKNVIPMRNALKDIQKIGKKHFIYNLADWVEIIYDFSDDEYKCIKNNAKALIPWRKGPFKLGNIEIDSEWTSYKKYNLLRKYFNLKDKIVADVGCNNGYYMFRMLEDKPKKIVGFDPSPLFKTQFEFINTFIKSDIVYEMMGVEHIEFYEHKFDFIFMLGVIYHRSDPITTLKALNRILNSNGEIIVDSFMIDGDEEVSLTPKERYSMIPNIYFIPTINCFKNWLYRAGFHNIKVLETTQTDSTEQRATSWSYEVSLNEMLHPNNKDKTIEGYPSPQRVYLKAQKK